jgi:TonB-linked SusC/RagA family outer membrane protein
MTDSSLGKDEYSNTIGTPSHSLSWFGRANYSYKGRYLLTATFRADGSSKFAPNNHWGYFPSAAAAWRISDEPFMKAAKDSWLDNLKLRLSLGTSGADNIDASLWKETWTTKSVTVNNVPTTVYEPGDMMGNPDLKWERTISRNIGIDFGLFGRVNGSVELYWNTTKDILMSVPIDPTLGYTYQFQNVGQTSNKGIEFSVNADIIRTKDFHLSLNATYNYNHNNIDKLADKVNADAHTNWGSTMRKPNYDYCIRKGQPVGAIYGFKSEGFYKTSDFNYDTSTGVWTLKDGVPDTKSIVNYAGTGNFKLASGQTAFPGMVKFADANGDGVINDDDATKLGNAVASHTGGFNINASYKGFDASAGFTYQIGGKVYNANAMWSMMGNKDTGLGCNRLSIVSDCYKIYSIDDNGNLVAATTPEALDALNANAKYALNYSEYGLVSSEFVEDASYLRLQTLTVGYTLPKTLTNKFGISRFRIYFTGTNLFCITGYSGLDPDVNTAEFTGGFPTPNYDYNSYPKARSFTFGINLTF